MFVAKTSVVSVTTEQIAVQLFCNLLFLKGTLESRTLHSPAFFRIEICSAREKKTFLKVIVTGMTLKKVNIICENFTDYC